MNSGFPNASCRRAARLTSAAIVLGALIAAPVARAGAAPAPAPKTAAPKTVAKSATGTHAASVVPATPKQIQDAARGVRALEELGVYSRAAEALRRLRTLVPPDADLDLELALDLARSGQPDSAAALLWSPLLTRALADTLPVSRRHLYGWEREPMWTNGKFDGWHWYVARARAEVAATLGRWHAARSAAEACAAARPLAGAEWLILAVCAAKDGAPERAEPAAALAALLDPTLPEAHYLAGLYEWRAGRSQSAQREFRAAVALDSAWQAPAIALVRSRLPGAEPDTLPSRFLIGIRETGLLTSPARPKIEEFVQMDESAEILQRGTPRIPDSLVATLPDIEISLPVLVDPRGRAVLTWMPWMAATQLPPAAVSGIIGSLTDWRFRPARKNGVPYPVWATIDYRYSASPPAGGGARH